MKTQTTTQIYTAKLMLVTTQTIIKNVDFERCNHIFTPEIKSIMLATNILKRVENKKEVENDLLSMMAPPDGLEPNYFP